MVDDLHAGVDELQAVEEALDLGAVTQPHRDAAAPVGFRGRFERRVVVAGRVRQREVAAGRQFVDEPADDAVRVVSVVDEVEDRDEGERDGLRQVEGVAQLEGGQDALGFADVGVEVGGAALGRAGQQRAGVGEDDRVSNYSHT